jgi:Leucine-rich repeat (LRR) protein
MQTYDLSYNKFEIIPVEIGNMELLKILHEWEVGVSMYQYLQELNVSYCRLTEWPSHIDRIPKLQLLNLAGNTLTVVSPAVKENYTLKYLDLSNNQLEVLPFELYSLVQLEVSCNSQMLRCV